MIRNLIFCGLLTATCINAYVESEQQPAVSYKPINVQQTFKKAWPYVVKGLVCTYVITSALAGALSIERRLPVRGSLNLMAAFLCVDMIFKKEKYKEGSFDHIIPLKGHAHLLASLLFGGIACYNTHIIFQRFLDFALDMPETSLLLVRNATFVLLAALNAGYALQKIDEEPDDDEEFSTEVQRT